MWPIGATASSKNAGDRERPPLAREERVEAVLSERIRGTYADRDKTYSLRDSEIHALSEVGKFRVVATQDLAQFAYSGDRSRMEGDVESLRRQGSVRETMLSDTVHKPTRVVSPTKEGRQLLSRGKVVARDQAIYHGLKNPKEAFHDADLYRLYHKVSDEIDRQGGRVDRVILDYEMKEELYAQSDPPISAFNRSFLERHLWLAAITCPVARLSGVASEVCVSGPKALGGF